MSCYGISHFAYGDGEEGVGIYLLVEGDGDNLWNQLTIANGNRFHPTNRYSSDFHFRWNSYDDDSILLDRVQYSEFKG